MGWNAGYTLYESAVVNAYNTGGLTPEILKELIKPYQNTDLDHGGCKGLKSSDGLSADEIVVKILSPEKWQEYLDMPRPSNRDLWTKEDGERADALYWFMYDYGGAWREIMKNW